MNNDKKDKRGKRARAERGGEEKTDPPKRAFKQRRPDGGDAGGKGREVKANSGVRTSRQHESSAAAPLGTVVAPVTGSRLYHPFRANFNDHFETSLEALQDVLPALSELRQLTRPSAPEAFTLYDPYYCSGSIVDHWNSLGFPKVLHENRDFYKDVQEKTVPGPYDVVVTNPPFSEDHMQRMLNFLVKGQDRPWAFLAPDYVVAKPWYRELIKRHFTPAPPTGKGRLTATGRAAPPQRVTGPVAFELPPFLRAAQEKEEQERREKEALQALQEGREGEETAETAETVAHSSASVSAAAAAPRETVGLEPFYVIPKGRYDFKHPTGAGKDHSHFKSIWYVWPGKRLPEVLRATTVALLARPSSSHGRTEAPSVVHGLQALEEGKFVTATERRPNPQRRQQQHGHAGKRSY